MNDNTFAFLGISGSTLLLIGIIAIGMWGCPTYNVWSAEMSGRAEMAKAEQNRKIQIEEAKANLESQRLNSEAEVVRAEGMAKSIEIENGKLTTLYIHYLWVRNIDKMDGEKIYIPTEAGLPILEAKTTN
jgi:preprotein translocase subunit SecF